MDVLRLREKRLRRVEPGGSLVVGRLRVIDGCGPCINGIGQLLLLGVCLGMELVILRLAVRGFLTCRVGLPLGGLE